MDDYINAIILNILIKIEILLSLRNIVLIEHWHFSIMLLNNPSLAMQILYMILHLKLIRKGYKNLKQEPLD